MIGIYSITNKINGKRYIGKSSHIPSRFSDHKNALKNFCNDPEKYKRAVNRHLANAVKKYGIDYFDFEVIEEFDLLDPSQLADAEVKWIEFYNTTDRDFGYNLVKDSSSNVVVHEETKKLLSIANSGESNPNFGNNWTEDMKKNMSEIKKAQHESGMYDHMKTDEWRAKLSEWSTASWKDEERKRKMARKVAEATSTLRFEQYDKVTGELVGTYNNLLEIMDKYPDFHKISIYSACNGWKKSYKGYVWKSIKKS